MTTNKTAKIQFYEGTDEPVVPEIRLTRSKDGTTGQALFLFEKPQALSSITDGEITGMRMIDSEGEILTREVKVKFVDGEPTIDMLGVEPRRYGNYATKSYLKAKNEEAYSHVFIVHYPDEERPAARPLRTSP